MYLRIQSADVAKRDRSPRQLLLGSISSATPVLVDVPATGVLIPATVVVTFALPTEPLPA